MTNDTPTPSAPKQCFCRSGTMRQCDICICTCCEHQETMLGNSHLRPKEQGSAPLTPEEVETLLHRMEANIAKALAFYSLDESLIRAMYADAQPLVVCCRTLQSQLKTRTEDAERMAGALHHYIEKVCGHDKHTDNCSCKPMRQALSSLHHIYPPKP